MGIAAALIYVCLLSCTLVTATNWAVVVAGSNGYWNYRHQSDTCHAYQIVSKNGMKAENIIMLYYDDIANDTSNPFPNQMFNKPTTDGEQGVNVYQGCQHDYVGEDCTADTFISVLTGNKMTGPNGPVKKVLKSTAEDNVFVYFTDHGSSGVIAFPVGDYLTSQRLNRALRLMYNNKMYKRLVFYLEACESGSMFNTLLPKDINIYATTAANPSESSWGYYCPPDDKVNGKEVGSCLGDEYSIHWMEDTDEQGMKETLQQQFESVKKMTKLSHVMQYGNVSIASMTLGEFMGDQNKTSLSRPPVTPKRASTSAINSRDVKLHTLYYRYLRAGTSDQMKPRAVRHAAAQELIREIEHRLASERLFLAIATEVVGADKAEVVLTAKAPELQSLSAERHDDFEECFDGFHRAMLDHCERYSDYSIQYARVVGNLCAFEPRSLDTMLMVLEANC